MWPMTNVSTDGTKLITGTVESNYLVTASTKVDSVHLPEVGPSTKSFLLNSVETSKNIQKFLQLVQEILKFYNTTSVEEIRILYNQDLIRILTKLANVLTPLYHKGE